MKIIKKIALILLLVLVAMQFYRPGKNSSQGEHLANFLEETNPSKEVQVILKNACYDCHSNNTIYPWYSRVAPISYWLADHVEEGKEELNFSAWESYSDKKKSHKLEEIVEVVEDGEMPLESYTWVHSDAQLSKAQKDAVMAWANQSRVLYQLNQQPR